MTATTETPILSARFSAALAYAHQKHYFQVRKCTEVPYISHLMAVSAIVLENGGNEDEAIAALLHDAVEDQGGQPTLNEIRQQFGHQVANIVEACSDTDQIPKPPWQERKENYIAHLKTVPAPVLLVSCADKLHNASTILYDFRRLKMEVFKRFNASWQETLWYYEKLVEVFNDRGPKQLASELERTVAELNSLVSSEPK